MPSTFLRPRSTAALAALLLASALGATPARAAEKEAALAEALFRDGQKLMRVKKYAEACPKLEESYRMVAKLGTLLNLATCHDKEGKTGSAWGEYTRAVTLAKKAGEKKRVAYARSKLKDIEGRLSKLSIEVADPPEGLEVAIDGEVIARAAWGTPFPVDPGTHAVTAKAPGRKPYEGSIEVPGKPGRTVAKVPALEVAPVESPPPVGPAPKPEPEPAAEGGTNTALLGAGIAVGVVGLAGVGVGSVFGVDTINKQDESLAHCNGTLCNQTGVDLREDGATSATLSTVLIAVGGAATAAGLVMVIVAATGDDAPADDASGRWIAPVLAPGYAGIGAGARF